MIFIRTFCVVFRTSSADQEYTAGRNYLYLAATISAWPQLFVPFSENVKNYRFKYYFKQAIPQYLSSYLIIQL
jgi:hypothetical protein